MDMECDMASGWQALVSGPRCVCEGALYVCVCVCVGVDGDGCVKWGMGGGLTVRVLGGCASVDSE